MDGSDLVVPTGVGKQVRQFLSKQDEIIVQLADNGILEYKGNIPLYGSGGSKEIQLWDFAKPMWFWKDADGNSAGSDA